MAVRRIVARIGALGQRGEIGILGQRGVEVQTEDIARTDVVALRRVVLHLRDEVNPEVAR